MGLHPAFCMSSQMDSAASQRPPSDAARMAAVKAWTEGAMRLSRGASRICTANQRRAERPMSSGAQATHGRADEQWGPCTSQGGLLAGQPSAQPRAHHSGQRAAGLPARTPAGRGRCRPCGHTPPPGWCTAGSRSRTWMPPRRPTPVQQGKARGERDIPSGSATLPSLPLRAAGRAAGRCKGGRPEAYPHLQGALHQGARQCGAHGSGVGEHRGSQAGAALGRRRAHPVVQRQRGAGLAVLGADADERGAQPVVQAVPDLRTGGEAARRRATAASEAADRGQRGASGRAPEGRLPQHRQPPTAQDLKKARPLGPAGSSRTCSSQSCSARARRQVDLLRPRAATSLSSSRLSEASSATLPGGGSSTGAAGSSRRYRAGGSEPLPSGKACTTWRRNKR